MKKTTILLFGVVAYTVFLAVFLYLVAFVGDVFVPYTIDAGRVPDPVALAVVVNLALVLAFGLQHSVMARTGFKAWLHRMLPASAERSVYVLVASLVLALLMWQWRPIPVTLWEATSTPGQVVGWSVFGLGFGIVLLSTWLIDHFELFGLKQSWSQFVERKPRAGQFMTPFLYRVVRHPLYLGFLLAFWGTPHMTAGHALFAAGMTAYILIAIRLEERDLVHAHGPIYARYQRDVPMILPVRRPLPR
ncbi:MAG: methanethiol S-methyltransferase [Gammaproteobacteria bacterium]